MHTDRQVHTDRQADRQKYISFNTINASKHKYINTIDIHMCVYQVRKARASCFNVHSKSIARLFVVAQTDNLQVQGQKVRWDVEAVRDIELRNSNEEFRKD